MYKNREKCPYAGLTVKIKADVGIDPMTGHDLGNQDFTIEDYWENVYGLSWMHSDGNPAALLYAIRTGMRGGAVPINNDVLYGKIGMMGYLFHISELCLPDSPENTDEDDDRDMDDLHYGVGDDDNYLPEAGEVLGADE